MAIFLARFAKAAEAVLMAVAAVNLAQPRAIACLSVLRADRSTCVGTNVTEHTTLGI